MRTKPYSFTPAVRLSLFYARALDRLEVDTRTVRRYATKLQELGIPLVPDPRLDQNFFQRSDNYGFALRGIPAHTLSSFNLHTDYHRPGDEVVDERGASQQVALHDRQRSPSAAQVEDPGAEAGAETPAVVRVRRVAGLGQPGRWSDVHLGCAGQQRRLVGEVTGWVERWEGEPRPATGVVGEGPQRFDRARVVTHPVHILSWPPPCGADRGRLPGSVGSTRRLHRVGAHHPPGGARRQNAQQLRRMGWPSRAWRTPL